MSNEEHYWQVCDGCGELFDRAHGFGEHNTCYNRLHVTTPLERMRRRWEQMRARVAPGIFMRDGHKCVRCGSTDRLTVDHIIPIVRGGTNDEANLQTLCGPCNSGKRDR